MNQAQRCVIERALMPLRRDLEWHKMKAATTEPGAQEVGTISDHRVQIALIEQEIAALSEGLT